MFIFLENKPFVIGSLKQAVDFVLQKINPSDRSQIVLPCSLNDLALGESSFYKNVDFYTSDSMFLTYFFRWKLRKKVSRVYGPDLMLNVLQKEQKNSSQKKHYFLAPNKTTAAKITTLLQDQYSKLSIDCEFLPKNPHHQTETNVLQKIIETKPNFVWLGIGSPKQIELASYLKDYSSGIKIFCVGAAFDFLTGQKKQAPSYLRNLGLEWFFRLLTEPKRLWKRYLIVIPKYLLMTFFRKVIRRDNK